MTQKENIVQGQALQQMSAQSPQTAVETIQIGSGVVSVADFEAVEKWAQAPSFLTCKDIQGLLGIGKNKAYQFIARANLQRDKYGKDYVYPKRCLIEYLVWRFNNSQTMLAQEIKNIKGED